MFQDSIRLLVHPNKETILDIIQSVTFKGAICLYTLAWVILRIIMGNAGIDVLHILPILDHKLVYVNYIIVFIVDYIYIMFKTIILASLLWLLLKWWHSTSLKSFIVMTVNVNIRMYNFDDVQCTVIPSVAYGFVTGMNLQLC